MGNMITFPTMRSRPHVMLVWDWAWDQYRVQAIGAQLPAPPVEWHEEYDAAHACMLSLAARLGLPTMDRASHGRAAG